MNPPLQLELFPLESSNEVEPFDRPIPIESESIRRRAIQAIQERRVCRVAYSADGGAAHTRAFEPYAITRVGDHWSIVGFCRLRSDFRTFRSDRIRSFEVLDQYFEPRPSLALERFILRRRGAA